MNPCNYLLQNRQKQELNPLLSWSRLIGSTLCILLANIAHAQNTNVVSPICDFEVSAELNHPTCAGESSGSIALSIISTEGTAVELQWLENVPASNDGGAITDLPAGTYSVIAFNETCQDTFHFVLQDPDPILAEPLDTSICGSSFIDVLEGVSGGSGNYTTEITTIFGAELDCITCPLIEVSSYTILNVLIMDENGCTAERPIVVNVHPVLEAFTTVVQLETCDDNGIIEVNATGGSSNYLYRRLNANNPPDPNNNYQASNVFTNLAGGNTYLFQVYDPVATCTTEVETELGIAAVAVEASVESTDVTCHNSEDGSITLTASAVDQVLGYSLNDSDPSSENVQQDATFSNLAPGNYTVYLFLEQDQACVEYEVDIEEPEPVSLEISTTDASCDDSSDGQVEFNGNGGTGTLLYAASDYADQTDASSFSEATLIDSLGPGLYLAQMTDSQGCTTDTLFTINAPEAPEVNTLVTHSCPGENSGSIVIVESGKLLIGFYEFSIDNINWQTDTLFSGLEAGIYTLYVRNLDGCVFDDYGQLQVLEVQPPMLNMTIISPSCPELYDGIITIESSSTNTNPYRYSLDGVDYFEVSTFSGLGAGMYTLYVLDDSECIFEFPFEMEAPEGPTFNLEVEEISCHGEANGSIQLNIEGGQPPFEHAINGGAFEQTSLFTPLSPGDYIILTRDANGCLFANSKSLTDPEVISANINIVHETCSDQNGILSCAPSGGEGSYEVAWSTGASTYLINNLAEGVYEVTITDAAECSIESMAVVEDQAGPVLAAAPTNVHCNSASSGAIDLDVLSGTMPYNFFWSNGATSEDVSGLYAGNYSVTVIDQNGCQDTRIYTIYEPEAITLSYESGLAGDDWFINLSVEGGVQPYEYLWSTGETTQDIFNLAPGTYTVEVSDDLNCKVEHTILIGSTSLGKSPKQPKLIVFPNPASNHVFIETDIPSPKTIQYIIFDSKGQEVKSGQLQGAKSTIPLNVPAGMYFLHTTLQSVPYVKKIVIVP